MGQRKRGSDLLLQKEESVNGVTNQSTNSSLYDVDPTTTNINWLGINTSERGKKRAQNIMDWVISNETKSGKSLLTLEVPGTSKDARHIYEKKGFKAGSKISDEDDVWGGLTEMKKRLK